MLYMYIGYVACFILAKIIVKYISFFSSLTHVQSIQQYNTIIVNAFLKMDTSIHREVMFDLRILFYIILMSSY